MSGAEQAGEDSVESEAAAWSAYTTPLRGLHERLRTEFRAQDAETGLVPLSLLTANGLLHVLTIPPGALFPRLLRERPGGESEWEVLLDFAAEAAQDPTEDTGRDRQVDEDEDGDGDEDEGEFILGDVVLDPAGAYLAYTVDRTGADTFDVRIRDLAAGASRRVAESAAPSLAWDTRHNRLLHLALDVNRTPVGLHALDPLTGEHTVSAALEPTGEYVELSSGSDGRHVLLSTELHTRRSVFLLDGNHGAPAPLLPPGDDLQVRADVHAGRCAAIVSDGRSPSTLMSATDLRVLPVPASRWTTHYRARPGEHLDDVVVSDRHIHVVLRHGHGQRLLRFDVDAASAGGEPVPVAFPDPLPVGEHVPHTGRVTAPESSTALGGHRKARSAAGDRLAALHLVPGVRPPGSAAEVVRACWTDPSRWYRLDERRPSAVPRDDAGSPSGAGPAAPGVDVLGLEARSDDGTIVPLTLLRPAGSTGALPTVLYAYGAYGLPVDPEYSVFRPSLFRRGVAFAVAHVRGGGEHGPAWHRAGNGPNKLRAVEDYLACARLLTGSGLTVPDALVARARSAGAAVVGAAVNRDPGLFRAGVLEVPFVDCLATLLRPDDPLAALEWDEWGNPIENPGARAALARLSPVDNVAPGRYPAMLLTAGLSDVRVSAAEPLRFAAGIRRVTTSGRPVLVRIDGTGHLGHSDADDDLMDEAEVLAFILRETGVVTAAGEPAVTTGSEPQR
ncbi:prolyl oligopeptidase family serine peptidase [Streptomyces sp. NRRL F-5126]|uniref:prolyl oligopeptidase family serine peptidase n=1 Tax=Streptomyces sp. NRRL F-5126 TaxID=1463857 RepID=UPI0004C8B66F|nr:prolyl oligopeptidase family serine peptidase [Streptomyces sp. NRRL F-5126]